MEAQKWIGVDIHKKQLTVCIIEENGKVDIQRYKRDSEGIGEFLRKVDKDSVIGVESTTWTWDLARKVGDKAKEVLIFNTIELKSLMDKTKKTDRIDCEKIATILRRFEKDELSTCIVKSEKWAEVKGLLKIRERLVRQKVETKNLIIAMLDFWGVSVEQKLFRNKKKDAIFFKELKLTSKLKEQLVNQYDLVMNFEGQIKGLDKDIAELCSSDKGYEALLENITGIGKTCGAYLVSKIENVNRFDDPKKLVSYLGLAPKVNESDGKNRGGHISHNTDKALLRVIVQAAWAAVRFDPQMRLFYDNLRVRTGKNKAIIAVARKLVVYTYFTLKNSKA